MKDNYLVLNGKRIDLTEEQLKILGIELDNNYFERDYGDIYYYINSYGEVDIARENCLLVDNERYNTGNYCKNRELIEQRALHETLNRLLWRFSIQNDGDKIDWNNFNINKYYVYYDNETDCLYINSSSCCKKQSIYFYTKEIAQRAINEIITPFIVKHPEFIW